MSTSWNKIYSVQNSQPIERQHQDMRALNAARSGAAYPAQPWSAMEAARPRHGPQRGGSPYERIPCRVCEPCNPVGAASPPRSERAARVARDQSILMPGGEPRSTAPAKTQPEERSFERAPAGARHADEAAIEAEAALTQYDPIRLPAGAPFDEGTDSSNAPAAASEPQRTRYPALKASLPRARARRAQREAPECAREGAPCADPSRPSLDPNDISSTDPRARGLLCYKKWWFLRKVGISVCGKMIVGTPIFLREDALRVINDEHSYIIPIRNVDYIRTSDGLDAACEHFEDCK